MTDVLVANIDIDKIPQFILLVIKMLAKLAMSIGQLLQSAPRRRCLNLDLRVAARKLPQRRWYNYCY